MSCSVDNYKFKTKLFDKKDAFSFSSYNFWTSIFHKIFIMRLSIWSEMLRFAKTIPDSNIFISLSNQLLERMWKQDGKHRSITSN